MKIGEAVDRSQNALRAVGHAIKTAGLYAESELKMIYVVDFKTANDDCMSNEDAETIRQHGKFTLKQSSLFLKETRRRKLCSTRMRHRSITWSSEAADEMPCRNLCSAASVIK